MTTPKIPLALIRESFRFFFENAGYVVGERAKGAFELANAELVLTSMRASGKARISWEEDCDPDISWMDAKTLWRYRKGELYPCEIHLEKKCTSCGAWETVETLCGIFTTSEAELSDIRLYSAELMLEALEGERI